MATELDVNKFVTDFSRASKRVFFESRQKTFGEAFTADVYDDIVDIFPVLGDLVGTGPRLLDATDKNDKVAGTVRAANAALGAIPGLGVVLDLLFPASGIITYLDYNDCLNSGKTQEECLFPEGSMEKDLMELQNANK